MKLFNFEFMEHGNRDPTDVVNGMFRDLEQAKDHCRSLFEGRGKARGALRVRVRENSGPVIFSWPENV
jgi:hypothetical protein